MQESMQPTLFGETSDKIDRRGMAVSVSENQTQIIRWILRLYNRGLPFDVDATYSLGVFYKSGIPQPRYKFDIVPQADGVKKADSRAIPMESGSVGSIMFDPPFKMSISKVEGIIQGRFSSYASPWELWDYYADSLKEFNRLLVKNGIVVFKCQDQVSSGRQWWTQVKVHEIAAKTGFDVVDRFVLLARSVIWSPNMRNQRHARKAHSYFIVLRKRREAT